MKKFLIVLMLLLCLTPLFGCNDDQAPEAPAEGTVLPEGYKFLVIEDEETGNYYEGFVNEENRIDRRRNSGACDAQHRASACFKRRRI